MGHCSSLSLSFSHLSKEAGEPGDLSGSVCSCILWSSYSFMSFHLVEDTLKSWENVIKSLTTNWLCKGWNQKNLSLEELLILDKRSEWAWTVGEMILGTAERRVAEGMVFCFCMGISFACFNGVSRSLMKKWRSAQSRQVAVGLVNSPRFPQSQISTWLLPPTPLQVKHETSMSGWACFQGSGSFSAGSLVFSVMPGTSEPFCTHLLNEWMLNELPSLTEVQEKVHQLSMTGEGSSHISAPVGLGILALNKFA